MLVNGPVAAEGVAAWTTGGSQPHLQLVLHLTEGPCCAPPELVPDLVDARGTSVAPSGNGCCSRSGQPGIRRGTDWNGSWDWMKAQIRQFRCSAVMDRST